MNKKLLLLFFSAIIYTISSGQVQYGLKAGLTQSFIKENSDENIDMNLKSGFQIGLTADIPLAKNLSLRPSLQYTQKGFKAVLGSLDGPSYWYRKASFNYLELPADLVYNFNIGKKTRIFIGSGPVLSFALSGKMHGIISGTLTGGQVFYEEHTDNKIFQDEGNRRIDVGLDFLTGVQFHKILLAATYSHGLTNMVNYDNDPQSLKNRSFAFTVGYLIGDIKF